jgi:mutator protein MutT
VSVKLILVAACALIDADGRVLIAERPPGKPMAGLWEFPGGKVESGEQPEETLIRELKEELGIDVKQECLAPLTFALLTLSILLLAALLSRGRGFARFIWILLCVHNAFLYY